MANKRIVAIAIDGSENSSFTFDWYLENVRQPRDFVILIHVQETGNLPFGDPAALQEAVRDLTEKSAQVTNFFEAKAKEAELPFKVSNDSGKPGEVICKVAEEEGASVIVTGSRGLGFLRRTMVGSVSDYIIHHSAVPVVVCRQP